MVEDDKRTRASSLGASRVDALSALRKRPIHSSWLTIDGTMPTGAFADRPRSTASASDAGVAWKRTER